MQHPQLTSPRKTPPHWLNSPGHLFRQPMLSLVIWLQRSLMTKGKRLFLKYPLGWEYRLGARVLAYHVPASGFNPSTAGTVLVVTIFSSYRQAVEMLRSSLATYRVRDQPGIRKRGGKRGARRWGMGTILILKHSITHPPDQPHISIP